MIQNIFRLGGWTDLNQVTGPSITALADPFLTGQLDVGCVPLDVLYTLHTLGPRGRGLSEKI